MFDSQFGHLSQHTLSVLRASNAMDSTLLITGSTGTGKSHIASVVHRASLRRGAGRWGKVNLATLSESLIESELFGHERGAFTSAEARRTGKLEICNGGTVFLDEIGELPLRLQAKLLDFIQYKKISPVGSNRDVELDVRIIAATNRNLEAAVRAGQFRADLYHRLNVFHVRLPDLALNPGAAIALARKFLAERAAAAGKTIVSLSREVEQVVRHHRWPGNVRELENMIEFGVAMENTHEFLVTSLPAYLQEFAREALKLVAGGDGAIGLALEPPREQETPASAVAFLELPITMDFHESKDLFEKSYLEHTLRLCSGQINLTSRRIGLNKVSLADKIRKHGIDWRRIRYEALGPALTSAS